MSKTHYATVERGNESNPYDEWSDTICGMPEPKAHVVSDQRKHITCKNCLRALEKFDNFTDEYLANETYPLI